MEYPRHLHKPDGLYVVVKNAEDHEKLTARGWLDKCPAYVERPKHVKLYDALHEAPIESAADESGEIEPPKRRGRKPKDE